MRISQIISKSLPTLLNSNFQKVYDFLENKYWDYDIDFSNDFDEALFKEQNFYYSLNIYEPKHLSIIFKILLLCDLYGKSHHFLKIYDYLKQNNIDAGYVIDALRLSNITINNNEIEKAFTEILKTLEIAYENDENIMLLNQIVKVYIFSKLKLKRMLKSGYTDTLAMFKIQLSKGYAFLDMNFLNPFLKEAEDKNIFFNKWSKEIHNIKTKAIIDTSENIYAENSPYAHYIRTIPAICFNYILDYCSQEVNNKRLHIDLNHGTRLLDTHEDLITYIKAYGKIHKQKLYSSFEKIKELLSKEKEINIIDYGCGQALGTINLIDFIRANGFNIDIEELILIEPSKQALERAILHSECFLKQTKIIAKAKYLNDLNLQDLLFQRKTKTTIHIFSNVLDMVEIMLDDHLYNCIEYSLSSNNIFICVSPSISYIRNNRLDIFYAHFRDKYDTTHISNEVFSKFQYGFTKYEQIFQVKL